MMTADKANAYACAITLTVVLCVTRFAFPSRSFSTFSWFGTYEAVAHIAVGGLIGAAIVKRSWFIAGCVLFATVVEIIAAVTL